MSLVERYLLKITATAFLGCLGALTAVIWITQALKGLDLLTGKGQGIIVFLIVTGLSLPALIAIIAPAGVFIATAYALNRVNSDSELVVMSAAGSSPWRLLKPFLALAIVVSLLVGAMTVYVMPSSFQSLRDIVTRIRADFVSNIVKEGQFTTLDAGLTFHYRERAGDALLGIFLQDRREKDKTVVYIAERGQTVDVKGQSYLVLEKGSIQRQEAGSRDSSIVAFDRYAIDLSAVGADADLVYKPRERSTQELLFPNTQEAYYQAQAGRFRAELHDRFSAALYPLAFMLIGFAALGQARTTRQSRGLAIGLAILVATGARIAGFAASSAAVQSSWAIAGIYGVPLLVCFGALVIIFKGQNAKRRLMRPLRGQAIPC